MATSLQASSPASFHLTAHAPSSRSPGVPAAGTRDWTIHRAAADAEHPARSAISARTPAGKPPGRPRATHAGLSGAGEGAYGVRHADTLGRDTEVQPLPRPADPELQSAMVR